MKTIFNFLVYIIATSAWAYKIGINQASLNVHSYKNVNSSIVLACTAMIEEKPKEEVQHNIDSYYYTRKVLGKK